MAASANGVAKHAGGRPSDYEFAFCGRAVELGRKGKSRAYIAASLGCVVQTLANWEAAHPEFLDAMAYARLLAQAWWEDAGQNGLNAERFSASAWSRSMAARFPDDWREKTSHEVSGKDGAPIPVRLESLTDAQLAQLAQRLGADPRPADGGGAGDRPPASREDGGEE